MEKSAYEMVIQVFSGESNILYCLHPPTNIPQTMMVVYHANSKTSISVKAFTKEGRMNK